MEKTPDSYAFVNEMNENGNENHESIQKTTEIMQLTDNNTLKDAAGDWQRSKREMRASTEKKLIEFMRKNELLWFTEFLV